MQICQVTYTVNPKFPHKCLQMECKNCLDYVNIYEHQCYITSDDERKLLLEERIAKNFGKCIQEVNKMETENGELVQELHNRGIERTNQQVREDLQRFRRERQELIEDLHIGLDPVETENRGREEQLGQQRMTAVEGLVFQGLEVEEITDDMITDKINEMEAKMQQCLADRELQKFMVLADVECQLDETNTFVPILICFVREDDDPIYHHRGKNCIKEFIKTMI